MGVLGREEVNYKGFGINKIYLDVEQMREGVWEVIKGCWLLG